MEQSFEDILSSLLDGYEKSESKDIDALLKEKSEELGLTEESKALVKKASEYIDKFAEKTASLESAREEGISMKRWLTEDLDNSMAELSDDEKAEIFEELTNKKDDFINKITEEE